MPTEASSQLGILAPSGNGSQRLGSASVVADKRLLSARAVQRAKERLAEAHREEYVVLLNRERKRLGLERIRTGRWHHGDPPTPA